MGAHVPEDQPFVSGDRVQLQQVLLNLVVKGIFGTVFRSEGA